MVFHGASLHAASLLVEAESFTEKGGWVVDQQWRNIIFPCRKINSITPPVKTFQVMQNNVNILFCCLIDRPVVGGNNSSEIRVHLGGAIEIGKYPELGGSAHY